MPREDDNGWRPIESAPKHGFEILAYWAKSKVFGIVAWNDDGCWVETEYLCEVSTPTYWRKLPEAPHDR